MQRKEIQSSTICNSIRYLLNQESLCQNDQPILKGRFIEGCNQSFQRGLRYFWGTLRFAGHKGNWIRFVRFHFSLVALKCLSISPMHYNFMVKVYLLLKPNVLLAVRLFWLLLVFIVHLVGVYLYCLFVRFWHDL